LNYLGYFPPIFLMVAFEAHKVAATLRSQSNAKAIRVEPISIVVKSLGTITCDSCEGKLASYDIYIESGIANVSFLKRYCSICVQMISH
jgi:hypothetical protein